MLLSTRQLTELYPEAGKSSATRVADKLAKVRRRDGRVESLLVHLEVQGKGTKDFPKRMFTYYYRILDRFRRPVTAVAIFTGKDGHRIPDRYEHRFLGTEVTYKYNVLRIAVLKEEDLAGSLNPFATVVLIARKALLRKRMTEEKLMEVKLQVATGLVEKGFDTKRVKAVMLFLERCLVFKDPENNRIFKEKLDIQTNKNNPMGIIEMFKEECEEKGVERSIVKLIEKTDFSDDRIAEILEVPVVSVSALRKKVLSGISNQPE